MKGTAGHEPRALMTALSGSCCAVCLGSTSSAAPIVVEAESFDGLCPDDTDHWTLEYAPGASMGKQIRTGGGKACEVRRQIVIEPGKYIVWAELGHGQSRPQQRALPRRRGAVPFRES